jgi:hypothetical protein
MMKIGSKYRHFKGNEYPVLHLAKHSETLEDLVVYQALYGERGIWVLKSDQGFGFYPFLWTKEASDINKVHRSNIPIEEIWDFQQDLLKQM